MLPSPGRILSVSHPRRVWLITVAHGVNEFYSVALPPIIPLIVADLNISYAQAGGLLTAYYLMYSLFQLPAGQLADRFGQKHVLSLGMVGLSTGILIAAAAQSYAVLVMGQVIAGIGGSTYHPSGMSLISDFESDTTEGKAMGIHGFGGLAGTAAAPLIIGGIAVVLEWRIALAAGALIGFGYAAIFTNLFTIPDPDEPTDAGNGETNETHVTENDRPDGPDASVEGSTSDPRSETETPIGWLGGFETNLRRILNVPLTWWFAGLCLIQFLLAMESSAIRTFAPSYLFERLDESTGIANAIYFIMIVGGGVSNLGGGYLADRIDRRVLGFAGLTLSGVGLAVTPFLPASPLLLLGWFFVLGFVFYAASPAKNALAASYSKREFSGSLFGVMMTAGAIGSSIGPLLVGVLAERFGMTVAFPMIAVLGLLGGLAFVFLFRV